MMMYARWKDGEKLSRSDYEKYVVPFLNKPEPYYSGDKNIAYHSSTYRWS